MASSSSLLAAAATPATAAITTPEKRHRSVFELPANFFESCRLLPSPHCYSSSFSSPPPVTLPETSPESGPETLAEDGELRREDCRDFTDRVALTRWTCNTCKTEFESLQDQRSHFKSDLHRFNVKLGFAGKDTVKEEDFDELTSNFVIDYEISSISGSEDEYDQKSRLHNGANKGPNENNKLKILVQLQTGERVSIWKPLLLSESQAVLYDHGQTDALDESDSLRCFTETELIQRLNYLICEPRDNTHLRIVLLASGGHFAGCVFDGNIVVAHKTFHRYVVRAKAGKKQSAKDASGRAAHSAGASLRRHNELALKKDIQELLISWKSYFGACSTVFVYAPSSNHQLLFNGEAPYFGHSTSLICKVPFTVRRPTFKEAKRVYNQLTQIVYEDHQKEISMTTNEKPPSSDGCMMHDDLISTTDELGQRLASMEMIGTCSGPVKPVASVSSDSDNSEVICISTPLHEAAKSGDAHKVLELLEQGMDPCVKDERGQTPYLLASEKEVRNIFRRFMASNLDKWDWHAAKVPSPLTREMEESQAAKQAEKDAKRKARAKELKKLRKAKEKNTQAQAIASENAKRTPGDTSTTITKGLSQPSGFSRLSKEEELKATQAAEREKRAAAAERRMSAAAALSTQDNKGSTAPSASQLKSGLSGDINCSCCGVSLAGKVPFHRYHYKYCSTSCMHVHREVLEDG